VISKAFMILDSMAGNRDHNTIVALSQRTGIPKSTVHRILVILAEEGIVTTWPSRGYVLTPKLLSIGLKGLGQKDLLDVAIPFMRKVSEKTKETVSVNMVSGIERICVYRIEGEYSIIQNIKIGDRGPLLKGAVGKVLAARLSRPELMSMIEKYISVGELTGEQVPEILTEIEQVSKQGFAVSIAERVPGGASVAVPILDISGRALAALSISSMAERLSPETKDAYTQILLSTAKQITFEMGGPQL